MSYGGNIFDYKLPYYGDFEDDGNGSCCVWYTQGWRPRPGVYLVRNVASFHGDIEDYPEWEEFTLPEYFAIWKQAVRDCEEWEKARDRYFEEQALAACAAN